MKDLDFNIEDPIVKRDIEIIKDAIEDNETLKANISRGTGAPSGGSDMDIYVDDTPAAEKLYVNINGSWKSTSLT